jgi:hypothetical protein
VAVGAEVLILNLKFLYRRRVLQGSASFYTRFFRMAGSTIKGDPPGLIGVMEEFEELIEQGETFAGEGLLGEALSRFEAALALEPENPEIIQARG